MRYTVVLCVWSPSPYVGRLFQCLEWSWAGLYDTIKLYGWVHLFCGVCIFGIKLSTISKTSQFQIDDSVCCSLDINASKLASWSLSDYIPAMTLMLISLPIINDLTPGLTRSNWFGPVLSQLQAQSLHHQNKIHLHERNVHTPQRKVCALLTCTLLLRRRPARWARAASGGKQRRRCWSINDGLVPGLHQIASGARSRRQGDRSVCGSCVHNIYTACVCVCVCVCVDLSVRSFAHMCQHIMFIAFSLLLLHLITSQVIWKCWPTSSARSASCSASICYCSPRPPASWPVAYGSGTMSSPRRNGKTLGHRFGLSFSFFATLSRL